MTCSIAKAKAGVLSMYDLPFGHLLFEKPFKRPMRALAVALSDFSLNDWCRKHHEETPDRIQSLDYFKDHWNIGFFAMKMPMRFYFDKDTAMAEFDFDLEPYKLPVIDMNGNDKELFKLLVLLRIQLDDEIADLDKDAARKRQTQQGRLLREFLHDYHVARRF